MLREKSVVVIMMESAVSASGVDAGAVRGVLTKLVALLKRLRGKFHVRGGPDSQQESALKFTFLSTPLPR